MTEQELQNINQIDMECHLIDDDDSSFGNTNLTDDDRDLNQKTGIIVDLSDDEIVTPLRIMKVDTSISKDNISAEANFEIFNDMHSDTFTGCNEIDLETEYFDEEDEELLHKLTKKSQKTNILEIDDGLIDEELLEEAKKKKRRISTGEVEDNYWSTISKKHAASNKRGAYSASFHFAGNPKKEQDIFNHMMGSDTSDASELNAMISDASDIGGIGIAGESGLISGGDSSSSFSADGGGCCESLNPNNYTEKLNELFDIIGFEVFKNSDNSYSVIDSCDVLPEFICKDKEELIQELTPYIIDCIIYPLQSRTNLNINSFKEWSDWYTSDMKQQYPKCADDIAYCELLANHLDECFED